MERLPIALATATPGMTDSAAALMFAFGADAPSSALHDFSAAPAASEIQRVTLSSANSKGR